MTTALITIAHGRHDHLRGQRRAAARLATTPDVTVVVAIDDPQLAGVVGEEVVVVPIAGHPDGLPLAAARNAGAETALAAGADLLVFLDVDCLPGPDLIDGYAAAARTAAGSTALLCGPVAYLPPPPPGVGYDLDTLAAHPFHPARPAPADGRLETGGDHRLFWSLSFAVTAPTWARIGGFCTDYVGYGAEDTDFGLLAARSGVDLVWVGGAAAYHQWHSTSKPPVQHLDDILRNGRVFAERWGWWPMEGWLTEFAERGLVRADEQGGWTAATSIDPGASLLSLGQK